MQRATRAAVTLLSLRRKGEMIMAKLSETLYNRTKALWDKATEHPFVTGMAGGTLEADRFKAYMHQDYYYLKDYTEILGTIKDNADSSVIRDFLDREIEAVLFETESVHLPNMRRLGITDDEVRNGGKNPACSDYLAYLRSAAEQGTTRGLAALLQCSWSYAYIAKTVKEKYPEQVAVSPFADWFAAYTSEEYVKANAAWIDMLDSRDVDSTETENLCLIFEKCAGFELRFWDYFLKEDYTA